MLREREARPRAGNCLKESSGIKGDLIAASYRKGVAMLRERGSRTKSRELFESPVQGHR